MLRFFVILAFIVLLVGCGDNLNPLESEDSNPQVKIEVQALVLAEAKPDFVLGKIAGEECYEAWFLVSVSNLGNKEITLDDSSFIINDAKGAAIYSQKEVFVFDYTSVESSIGTAMKYLLNSDNEITFVIKPKSTELVGLFTVVPLEPIGEWNLVYGNRQVVISVQKEIEQAIASGKKIGDDTKANGKEDVPVVENMNKENGDDKEQKPVIGDMPMALIPAGEFLMGADDGDPDEKPAHMVYLDAFYMDVYKVTNAQYKKFVQVTGHEEPIGYELLVNGMWQYGFKPWSNMDFNGDNQPVVCVSWDDAKAYADWAGKRLPTEAEWEKAARGGLMAKKYVWGDSWPPPEGFGNFGDETLKRKFPDDKDGSIISGYNDGYVYTAPVGSFASNGYGLYDMAGNVWELCADWYDKNYYASSPKSNPMGPGFSSIHVIRGGSWYDFGQGAIRVSSRGISVPAFCADTLGFRCAMDAK